MLAPLVDWHYVYGSCRITSTLSSTTSGNITEITASKKGQNQSRSSNSQLMLILRNKSSIDLPYQQRQADIRVSCGVEMDNPSTQQLLVPITDTASEWLGCIVCVYFLKGPPNGLLLYSQLIHNRCVQTQCGQSGSGRTT